MKKLFFTTIVACISMSSYAGDHGWATAGKILTGVVIGDVLFNHLAPPPPPTVVVQQPVVYTQPVAQPVQIVQQPVYTAPAPVVYSQPVVTTYVQQPVYYSGYVPAPVIVAPRYPVPVVVPCYGGRGYYGHGGGGHFEGGRGDYGHHR